jgi:hypothetical protein
MITRIGKSLCDEGAMFGQIISAEDIGVDRRGVFSRQKARPARRADGILHVSLIEGNALAAKAVKIRRVYIFVSERADGIVPLLIGTKPENIRSFSHIGYSVLFSE